MRKKRLKTADDLHRHFRKRLGERYGIYVAKPEEISLKIRAGLALPVFKESNTRSRFIVEIDGKNVLVVYDNKRHAVVTALPFQEAL